MLELKLVESFQLGNATAVVENRDVEMVTISLDGRRFKAMPLAMAKDLHMELRDAIRDAEKRMGSNK